MAFHFPLRPQPSLALHRLCLLAGLLLGAAAAHAQQPPISPRESVAARIVGSDVTIVYGRPYRTHPRTGEIRTIWGSLVPFGKVWRTGANEATTLTVTRDIEIGGRLIPDGTYSLYMIPDKQGGQLIINRQTGQWGTQYDPAQDEARVKLERERLSDRVEQFTILIEPTREGGRLRFRWGEAEYRVPFRVRRPPPRQAS